MKGALRSVPNSPCPSLGLWQLLPACRSLSRSWGEPARAEVCVAIAGRPGPRRRRVGPAVRLNEAGSDHLSAVFGVDIAHEMPA